MAQAMGSELLKAMDNPRTPALAAKCHARTSKMKAVAQLRHELPGIIKMSPAEGIAVIEQVPAAANVQGCKPK